MGIRSFVLGAILLASVGFCMVQESIMQTQARYKLAELTRREKDMQKHLAKLKTQEENLRRPTRLVELARKGNMDLVSLGTIAPKSPARDGMASAVRLPGEVLDERFVVAEESGLASAGY